MSKKELILLLQQRFDSNTKRHQNILWNEILPLLSDDILESLTYMEESGGEPDVIQLYDTLIYVDCSSESPKGRRSFCYDKEARVNRKKFPPQTSVIEMIKKYNIELLTEEMYFALQEIMEFDCKSSSWILTNKEFRNLGGALFGSKRFKRVFVYQNAADSYYNDRGFRGYINLKK